MIGTVRAAGHVGPSKSFRLVVAWCRARDSDATGKRIATMQAPRTVPCFSLCVAVSVAALCASTSQPAWEQCSDPLARMWDNVKGPTNTNDQPGRIEVKFTACGDTGGPPSLGVRGWGYSSYGWDGRAPPGGGPPPPPQGGKGVGAERLGRGGSGN